MKQNITRKQWQELTLTQQHIFQLVSKKGGFPTIDRMIEFLIDNESGERKITYTKEPTRRVHNDKLSKRTGVQWRGTRGTLAYPELCDALWEAVKEVLNDR